MIKKKFLKLMSISLLAGLLTLNVVSAQAAPQKLKTGERFTVSKLNLGDKAYIIDYAQEDVTGDKIKDNVILVGTKLYNFNDRYDDSLIVVVQDGKSKKYSKSTYDRLGGYNGKLFIGDFSGDKINDVMVSAACGGTNGVVEHMISTFKDNKPSVIFSNKNNAGIKVEGKYVDDFKAELYVKTIDKKITLDLNASKDLYIKNKIYNKDGKLLEATTPYLNFYCLLNPIDYDGDGIYELEGYQSMTGTCNAERISTFKSILKFENNKWNIKNLQYSTSLIK